MFCISEQNFHPHIQFTWYFLESPRCLEKDLPPLLLQSSHPLELIRLPLQNAPCPLMAVYSLRGNVRCQMPKCISLKGTQLHAVQSNSSILGMKHTPRTHRFCTARPIRTQHSACNSWVKPSALMEAMPYIRKNDIGNGTQPDDE